MMQAPEERTDKETRKLAEAENAYEQHLIDEGLA